MKEVFEKEKEVDKGKIELNKSINLKLYINNVI